MRCWHLVWFTKSYLFNQFSMPVKETCVSEGETDWRIDNKGEREQWMCQFLLDNCFTTSCQMITVNTESVLQFLVSRSNKFYGSFFILHTIHKALTIWPPTHDASSTLRLKICLSAHELRSRCTTPHGCRSRIHGL